MQLNVKKGQVRYKCATGLLTGWSLPVPLQVPDIETYSRWKLEPAGTIITLDTRASKWSGVNTIPYHACRGETAEFFISEVRTGHGLIEYLTKY